MRFPRSPYGLADTVGVALKMFGIGRDGRPGPRAGELELSGEPAVRWLGFVGDIMPLLFRGVRFAAEIGRFFRDCDVVVGNLEGIVTEERWIPFLQKHRRDIFGQLAEVAPRWVLGVANNHAADYGRSDFERTLAAIEAAGMRHVGTSARPRLELIEGVTLTAWTELSNGPAPMVARADPGCPSEAGLHLAYVHWGVELERRPRADLQRPASGYAAIIGHHAHLAQAVEQRGQQLVAWSLGNFTTEVRLQPMGEGLLLKLGVSGAGRLVRAQWQPIVLDRSDRRWCQVRSA
jgi:poly-gamma-glutamate capsule biosynthesis protein CapA/YwtB (metallophosphatase superfamily)